MIKAVAGGPGGPSTVILGLSRMNTERLLDNQPILVSLRELHRSLPDIKVLLLAGETEDVLTEDLRAMGATEDAIQRERKCRHCSTGLTEHNAIVACPSGGTEFTPEEVPGG